MFKKPTEKQQEETTETETRQQAGRRLALKRMPQVKRALRRVARLGAYRMDERDVDQMIDAIDEWTRETKILLQNHSTDGSSDFRFN